MTWLVMISTTAPAEDAEKQLAGQKQQILLRLRLLRSILEDLVLSLK